MKILNASKIRELDTFTIENEPIKSIDLMERASLAFVSWFAQKFAAEENEIIFVFQALFDIEITGLPENKVCILAVSARSILANRAFTEITSKPSTISPLNTIAYVTEAILDLTSQ